MPNIVAPNPRIMIIASRRIVLFWRFFIIIFLGLRKPFVPLCNPIILSLFIFALYP